MGFENYYIQPNMVHMSNSRWRWRICIILKLIPLLCYISLGFQNWFYIQKKSISSIDIDVDIFTFFPSPISSVDVSYQKSFAFQKYDNNKCMSNFPTGKTSKIYQNIWFNFRYICLMNQKQEIISKYDIDTIQYIYLYIFIYL